MALPAVEAVEGADGVFVVGGIEGGGEGAGAVAAEPGEGEFADPDIGLGLGIGSAEGVAGDLDESLVGWVEALDAGEHAVADGVSGDDLFALEGARTCGELSVGYVCRDLRSGGHGIFSTSPYC